MADVFVSYSRQDSPFVTRLAEAIESRGKQVWIDTSGIEDTEVFPVAIRSAIESADAFLFVISPASVESRFCEQEVDYAHSLNKRLVPVLRDRVPDEQLPEAIRERSWIPFEQEAEFDSSLARVLSALETDLEYRRSHTRWLTKAIEWDKEHRDKSLLLRGSELRAAEAWLASTTEQSDPAPTTVQREYLLAGRQAAARRSRMLVSASLGVALIAIGLLVFALISRGQAVHAQTKAVHAQVASSAQALAVESENELTVDPEASVILAMRAVREQATAQTMLALREALDASPLLSSLPTVDSPTLCNGPTPAAAFRPGTEEIAENACTRGILLANAKTGRLIRELSTISNGTGLSYNANGTVLALGTWFGVSLLNPDTGAVEKVLLSGNTPGSVTFSPSGTMLGAAADGLGNQSELFDVGSGKEIQLGGSNPNSVEYGYGFNNSSLAFTPDGRFVIAGPGSGGATAVFDTATGKLVRTLNTGPPSLNGFPSFVATSPNASVPLLAVAFNTDSSNSSIEIWNTRTWKEEFLLTTTSDVQYSAVAFSPDGNRLAVAETNGSAAIWSIPTRREIVPLLGQTAAINSIAFSPEGTEVATASADGTVRVWRAGGPELDDLYLAGSIKSVGLSTDGVVVASLEGQQIEVSAWKMSALKVSPLSHFLIPGSSSYDVVSVSPDGRYVADFANRSPPCPVGQLCPSGLVRVYSVKTGQLLHTKSSDGVYPVAGAEAMAWSHDDHAIAVASSALEVVSLKTGLAVALSVQGAEQCGVDGAPAFSSNDSLVAWATVCGDVAVFRLSGESLGEPVGTPVSSFQVQGAPSGVAFNPAGTQLAVSNSSGAVVVFDPLTHRQEFALPTASSGVTSVAYSPDGRYLVTTLLDESAQIWGADGPLHGDLQRVDQNAAPLLIAPAFDAGGGDFATGDSAGTVKIWAECPACGDPGLLMKIAKGRVVAQLTPLEQGAKQ